MDRPLTRIGRLAEAIDIFEHVCTGEPYSLDGEHYTVKDLVVLPRPLRQPRQRLIMGGGGKHMLTLAARHADVVSVNPKLRNVSYEPKAAASSVGTNDSSKESTLKKIQWIRDSAGVRFDDIVLDVYVPDLHVGPMGDKIAAERAQTRGLDVADFAESPHSLIGEVHEIVEMLEQRRELYGVSMVHVHGSMLEAFAPVVEILAGR